MKKSFTVTQNDASGRLDKAVGQALGISRAKLKDLFDQGRVRMDGRRVAKGVVPLAGALVEVELPDEPAALAADAGVPLRILYEDEHVLALDKPAGVPVHPLSTGETGTLAQALIGRYPECASASPEAPLECGIAHRLDTQTSGVVLAARTAEAYAALRRMFGNGGVEKRYLALVGGLPSAEGEISLPVAHHPGDPKRMVACADDGRAADLKARPAVTRWRLKERHGDLALLDVEIPTGVRHQIRVHLAALGAPIAGDELYGGPAVPGLSRQFLHAFQASFVHPLTGRSVLVQAPLPDDLKQALALLDAT